MRIEIKQLANIIPAMTAKKDIFQPHILIIFTNCGLFYGITMN